MALKVQGEYAPEKHEHTGKDGKELFPALTEAERKALNKIVVDDNDDTE